MICLIVLGGIGLFFLVVSGFRRERLYFSHIGWKKILRVFYHVYLLRGSKGWFLLISRQDIEKVRCVVSPVWRIAIERGWKNE